MHYYRQEAYSIEGAYWNMRWSRRTPSRGPCGAVGVSTSSRLLSGIQWALSGVIGVWPTTDVDSVEWYTMSHWLYRSSVTKSNPSSSVTLKFSNFFTECSALEAWQIQYLLCSLPHEDWPSKSRMIDLSIANHPRKWYTNEPSKITESIHSLLENSTYFTFLNE